MTLINSFAVLTVDIGLHGVAVFDIVMLWNYRNKFLFKKLLFREWPDTQPLLFVTKFVA